YDYDEMLMTEYKEKLLESFPQISTLINSFTQKKAQVAFAEEMKILKGGGYIFEYLNSGSRKYKFKISPNSFFQTNTKQAELLYSKAEEFAGLKPADRVLDLYCGAGSISIFISGNVERVKGVELIKEAIESANENAVLNGVKNTEFELSDIKDYLVSDKAGDNESSGFNKVILDPPRSGLHPDICGILSNTRHEKIIYLSCNPGTQARDIRVICSNGKYRLGRIQPVDMFSQTYHVENVAELVST
ncbi:MAG: rRNA (uracil1939-C5)-methyltransferase, partial [Bacteroidota bacterium]|nr:rRNA (uracil1939-C5)-methyltransferase [Bacteroidota bacterium]